MAAQEEATRIADEQAAARVLEAERATQLEAERAAKIKSDESEVQFQQELVRNLQAQLAEAAENAAEMAKTPLQRKKEREAAGRALKAEIATKEHADLLAYRVNRDATRAQAKIVAVALKAVAQLEKEEKKTRRGEICQG